MSQITRTVLVAMSLLWAASASAEEPAPGKPNKPGKSGSAPTCKLDDPEVPRGGRLDVSGTDLGKAPLVRIAGKPARILERRDDRISVQVAADSDGGAVTVQTDGKTAECGQLVIIGKNR